MRCEFCKDYLQKDVEKIVELKISERTFKVCKECHDDYFEYQDKVIKNEIKIMNTTEKTHSVAMQKIFKLTKIGDNMYV